MADFQRIDEITNAIQARALVQLSVARLAAGAALVGALGLFFTNINIPCVGFTVVFIFAWRIWKELGKTWAVGMTLFGTAGMFVNSFDVAILQFSFLLYFLWQLRKVLDKTWETMSLAQGINIMYKNDASRTKQQAAVGTCDCEPPSDPDVTCIICMVHARNCLFFPCKHMATCMQCASKLSTHVCPICKAQISERLKVYM